MQKNSNFSTIPPLWRPSNVNKQSDFQERQKETIIFLLLDDKFKQRCKEKIYNITGYDPYEIKKNFQVILVSKFSPVQWQPIIVDYFLFSLSPLTKEELKVYKRLESCNQLAWRWVKEVKIKLSLNYPLRLPWLLDRSACNVFPSSFYCLILIRYVEFIASAKIQEHEGKFLGNCPTINHKC